jgi:hypothetical protein
VSGSGRADGRDAVAPAAGYNRRDNSTSSSPATLAQSLRFATLARRKQSATVDFPHPAARANCRLDHPDFDLRAGSRSFRLGSRSSMTRLLASLSFFESQILNKSILERSVRPFDTPFGRRCSRT